MFFLQLQTTLGSTSSPPTLPVQAGWSASLPLTVSPRPFLLRPPCGEVPHWDLSVLIVMNVYWLWTFHMHYWWLYFLLVVMNNLKVCFVEYVSWIYLRNCLGLQQFLIWWQCLLCWIRRRQQIWRRWCIGADVKGSSPTCHCWDEYVILLMGFKQVWD